MELNSQLDHCASSVLIDSGCATVSSIRVVLFSHYFRQLTQITTQTRITFLDGVPEFSGMLGPLSAEVFPQLHATADEIHISVGRPININLQSANVIHSFWVPSLHSKVDLVPGQINRIRIIASQAGVHRGPCAERPIRSTAPVPRGPERLRLAVKESLLD